MGALTCLAMVNSAGASALRSSVASEPATHEVSREQATQMLHERYGSQARVLRADEIDQGGRRVYVFRLLSANGRVWIVRIDAKSGAELP